MGPLMLSLRSVALAAALATMLPAPAWANDNVPKPADDLASYVARRDESFGWRELASGKLGDVEYVEYLLTSQTWRGVACSRSSPPPRRTRKSIGSFGRSAT